MAKSTGSAFFDDLELQVEPVFYAAILPKIGKKTEGLGDLEATATARFLRESGWVPNVAVAFEVKLPTARDSAIGTREYDYTPFLIRGASWPLVTQSFKYFSSRQNSQIDQTQTAEFRRNVVAPISR